MTDDAFKKLVTTGKHHCQIGDVFQIVLSRNFEQDFSGDDFQVYRALRSVNPSPYLYYFDYGSYKIFGSSPEQQLVIKDRIACVNPIAGTYLRTGNDEEDAQLARDLAKDPKENSEHIMLVDLARNDLGKHCKSVYVKTLKDIQFFSHVIHIVSKVEGELKEGVNPIDVFADTFPAGTLSGAPKYKAIELIDQYEQQNRHFYGGGIGFIGFNGDLTHAIVIRTFLSKDNVLYRQAGAGVVVSSVEGMELQEVNNKLGALKKAMIVAEGIN
jgi:anthranilate synthase component I